MQNVKNGRWRVGLKWSRPVCHLNHDDLRTDRQTDRQSIFHLYRLSPEYRPPVLAADHFAWDSVSRHHTAVRQKCCPGPSYVPNSSLINRIHCPAECKVSLMAILKCKDYNTYIEIWPIPVAARSKAWVCIRSLTGSAVSNSSGGIDGCLFWVCMLSGWGLRKGQITRPEESYKMWCVWVWSCSLDSEKALLYWGLLRHGEL